MNDLVADGAFGWPWETYAHIDPTSPNVYLEKIPAALEYVASPTSVLSVIGQPGLTAYFGIERFARPASGDTIVVSSAAGAVGTVVSQLAKRRGCRVIGLTSTDEKASFLVEKVGCDAGINYRSSDFAQQLESECGGAVSFFWDSVGGKISDTVIANMKENATIILCGAISDYDKTNEYPPPLSDDIASIVQEKNITRHRHLIVDYENEAMHGLRDLALLVSSGQLSHFETYERGLENAGVAYERLMKGENTGKMIVYVGDEIPSTGSTAKRALGGAIGKFGLSLSDPKNVLMYCSGLAALSFVSKSVI